jgi:hypothetical protein
MSDPQRRGGIESFIASQQFQTYMKVWHGTIETSQIISNNAIVERVNTTMPCNHNSVADTYQRVGKRLPRTLHAAPNVREDK